MTTENDKKIEQERNKNILGDNSLSIIHSSYELSNIMPKDCFIELKTYLCSLTSWIENMVVYSLLGDKHAFDLSKSHIKKSIKELLYSFENELKERLKEQLKEQNRNLN